MPNMDKTGPSGQGPNTGRGMGSCAGGFRRNMRGCCGRGMGYGRFSRRGYLNQTEEKEDLKEEAKNLKEDLVAIEERLKEIEK